MNGDTFRLLFRSESFRNYCNKIYRRCEPCNDEVKFEPPELNFSCVESNFFRFQNIFGLQTISDNTSQELEVEFLRDYE